jgi:hypothetical protein
MQSHEAQSDNPYAPPATHVADAPKPAAAAFYVVALRKFWVLMLITYGVYSIYWFYKNWALQRAQAFESIWPVPRAIFSIFFTFSLLDRVGTALRKRGLSDKFGANTIATVYIVSTLVSSVCDRLSYRGIAVPYTLLVPILMLPLIAWALARAQIVINRACGDDAGDTNASFTGWNWFWIVLGAAWWVLILVGVWAITMEALSPGSVPS